MDLATTNSATTIGRQEAMKKLRSNRSMRELNGLSLGHYRNSSLQARKKKTDSGRIAPSLWPELVGISATDAEYILRENEPYLCVEVLDVNDTDDLTLEYDAQRVQLFVDKNGKVLYTPQAG